MSEYSTNNRAVTKHRNGIDQDRKDLGNEVIFITQVQERLNREAEAYKKSLIRIHQAHAKLRNNDRTRLNQALADHDGARIALSISLRKFNFHVSTAHEITQKYHLKGEYIADYIESVDRRTGEVVKTVRLDENRTKIPPGKGELS